MKVSLILVLLCAISCTTVSKNAVDNKTTAVTEPYIIPNIEGHWKLVTANMVEELPFKTNLVDENSQQIISEGGEFEYEVFSDLVITKDSIFGVKYPIEMVSSSPYSIDSAYLNFNRIYHYDLKMPMIVKGDSLFLYLLGSQTSHMKETYAKAQFEDSVISVLKTDTINFPELAGKWYLQRDYWHDYGTHYVLDFNHAIADSIILTRQDMLNAKQNNWQIQLKTDGKYKTYTLDYRRPNLFLIPGDWYTEDDPYLHFTTNPPNY